MNRNMQYKLPNGFLINHINQKETDFVYKEIFEQKIYLKNGISLGKEAKVFDIGANIGLFTLFVKQEYPDAMVYAFEPSTEAFECLKRNTKKFIPFVKLYQYGVLDEDLDGMLTYYPNNSITSGFFSESHDEKKFLQRYMRNYLTMNNISASMLPSWYVNMFVDDLLKGKRLELCKVKAISTILKETEVKHIDLLKIDIESGEMNVLNNIPEDYWENIDQIVMEAHDCDTDRISQISDFLKSKKFNTIIEWQNNDITLTIGNIYAIRQ